MIIKVLRNKTVMMFFLVTWKDFVWNLIWQTSKEYYDFRKWSEYNDKRPIKISLFKIWIALSGGFKSKDPQLCSILKRLNLKLTSYINPHRSQWAVERGWLGLRGSTNLDWSIQSQQMALTESPLLRLLTYIWFLHRSQWTVMCVAIAFFATCLVLVR